jgi:hypothetical protein
LKLGEHPQAALGAVDDELKRNSKFAAMVASEAQRPEFERLRFESLLILPIQRIPRYELLLQNLRKAAS